MATNLLSAFLSKPTLTITDQATNVDEVKDLKTSRVQIRMSSEVFRHQLEDGLTFVDGRVLKPVEIDLSVIAPDIDTLTQVNTIMGNRSTRYRMKSRGIIIDNLLVNGDILKQSGEMLSATPIKMSMKQLMLDSVAPVVYNNPANNSLIDRGVALVEEAQQSIQTTVSGLYTRATGLIDQVLGG